MADVEGLTAVAEAMERLAEAMAEDTRRAQRRLFAALLGPLIIVGAIAGAGWEQSRTNARIGRDAKVTADFVRNCLIIVPTAACPIKLHDETPTTR